MASITLTLSDIETLADVVTKPEWNETTISERADWIAGKAVGIWPSYLPEEDEEPNAATEGGNAATRTGRNSNQDRTQYSLNGNQASSKSQFVLDVVKAYVAKHPEKTFEELEKVFPISLCSKGYKFLGLLCSEEKHPAWDNKYKDKRYSIGQPDGTLTSADGIKFYVNTQWSIDGMPGIVKLAKAEGFKVTTNTNSI